MAVLSTDLLVLEEENITNFEDGRDTGRSEAHHKRGESAKRKVQHQQNATLVVLGVSLAYCSSCRMQQVAAEKSELLYAVEKNKPPT